MKKDGSHFPNLESSGSGDSVDDDGIDGDDVEEDVDSEGSGDCAAANVEISSTDAEDELPAWFYTLCRQD